MGHEEENVLSSEHRVASVLCIWYSVFCPENGITEMDEASTMDCSAETPSLHVLPSCLPSLVPVFSDMEPIVEVNWCHHVRQADWASDMHLILSPETAVGLVVCTEIARLSEIYNNRGANCIANAGPSRLNEPRRAFWSGLGLADIGLTALSHHHRPRFLHHHQPAFRATSTPSSRNFLLQLLKSSESAMSLFAVGDIFANR